MSMTLVPEMLKSHLSDVFIETGTYDGAGVELALACGFLEIHSVEIDPARYGNSLDRFIGIPGVWIYYGDSPAILGSLLKRLDRRATLFLDAHPIGKPDSCPRGRDEWPLLAELRALRESLRSDHTILIDDRECFDLFGTSDDEVKKILSEINPSYQFSYERNKKHPDNVLVAKVP